MVKARILLVEDDAILRMDLERCLTGLGFVVAASYGSGEEAIESVPRARPDVVLMDIILKGDMDGVDAARTISSDFHIPVIYLSGYFDDVAVSRAKLTRPSGYLLKPYDRERLKAAIERAVSGRHNGN